MLQSAIPHASVCHPFRLRYVPPVSVCGMLRYAPPVSVCGMSLLFQAMALLESKEAPERMELSVCRITDREVSQISQALKNNPQVAHLNLAFNQITDSGIQALVTALATGAGKGLKELNVSNNPFGDMGKSMLGGVGMMRKGLNVIYESSI